MDDCLIVGAGVVGLSLAYELSQRGQKVRMLERGLPGQEASWAGAGLLPPANRAAATDSFEALAGLSGELHAQWADELRATTGVDTGFRKTGSLHLARDADSAELVRQMGQLLRDRQITAQEIPAEKLGEIEPALDGKSIRAALYLPDEAQIRNPRHLKALAIACQARGVTIESEVSVEGFDVARSRLVGVETSRGRFEAQTICLCGGAWTGALAARLGVPLPMQPVRGQIVLLSSSSPVLSRIINEGKRYLVPRPDGRVLIGSTEEEVGFDKRTTAEGTESLLRFAIELVPALGRLPIERTWAGLRPGTPDGLPYVGRLGQFENVFIAAGHYRGGLHLSPGTARVLAQTILGEPPEVDLSPFSPARIGRAGEIASLA